MDIYIYIYNQNHLLLVWLCLHAKTTTVADIMQGKGGQYQYRRMNNACRPGDHITEGVLTGAQTGGLLQRDVLLVVLHDLPSLSHFCDPGGPIAWQSDVHPLSP